MNSPLLYSPRDFFSVARDEAEVDNLLNNDIYKFLMLDFILEDENYSEIPVQWEMKIRSTDVQTGKVIDKAQLIEQLEATKSIWWVSDADLSYMRGILGPTWERLFSEKTLAYLKDFQFPDYELWEDETWNYTLRFTWKWADSMMWEIAGLKIINTLYNYNYIKKEKLSNVEFTRMMNQVTGRLFSDIDTLKQAPDAKVSEFGTRRSLSTDFQRMVNDILSQEIPDQYLGTSNVLLAKEMWWVNPIWTNAHELRMIPTAMSDNPFSITQELYDIDRKWQEHHKWLWILLPDTYGSSAYFRDCPNDIMQWHDWVRFDSKDPMIAIPEYIDVLLKNGIDPMTKMWIPSDGLNAQKIVEIQNAFRDKLGRISYGIGTNLSNNTKWTWPRETETMWPFWSFSVVIKPLKVQRPDGTWSSTVKLSDNPGKHMWDPDRVAFMKSIFGSLWLQEQEITV